jgi:hypothetical protein
MHAHTILLIYSCGAAALAIWLVARFPTFGPETISGSTGALLAAFCLAAVVPTGVHLLIGGGNRIGGVVALVGLVLPTLAGIFWAAVRLFRALFSLFPGLR